MLSTSALKRVAAEVARYTGLGAIGLAFRQRQKSPEKGSIRQVGAWGEWADAMWGRCRELCSFAVQRDRRALESLYPLTGTQTKVFLIEQEGRPVGWSVCFNSAFVNHRHFGNLQVGSILDCMAAPDAMASVAILSDRELARQGADLVLVNHSHRAWVEAFHAAGFLDGPSNYILGMTKKLSEIVRAEPDGEARVHITRGDGDGRIHLA